MIKAPLRAAAPVALAPGVEAWGPTRRGAAATGWNLARVAAVKVGIMACMAEAFRLHAADGCEWVVGPPVDPYGDGYVNRADVEIHADGLTARTTATLSAGFERVDLVSFFAGLVSDWRGWEGHRRWEALEHEMAIDSWHDGRANVMIAVTVRRSKAANTDDAWSARVVFTVEAGEQLSAVAADLGSLLAV